MLTAEHNSLAHRIAAHFPKAGCTVNNEQGPGGKLHCRRQFAESISAEARFMHVAAVSIYFGAFLDSQSSNKRCRERESRLSRWSGIIVLGVILQLNVTVAAAAF